MSRFPLLRIGPRAALIAALLAACAFERAEPGAEPADPCAGRPCDGFAEGPADSGVVLSAAELPAPRRGLPYEAWLRAEGGLEPYRFSLAGGALPEGLELAEDGRISGVPTGSGRSALLVRVTDSDEPAAEALADYRLEVPRVLLLSGYGPFDGLEVNPSWEAARGLDGELLGGVEVRAVELRVVWDEAPRELLALVDELAPAAVVASGVASSREEAFSLERVARNVEWGTDVEQVERRGTSVVEGGPDRLESTLPLGAIGDAFDEAGISWAWSDHAGLYLCNHLFYSVVHATARSGVPAGFVHVSDRNATVEELRAGLRVALRTVAAATVD